MNLRDALPWFVIVIMTVACGLTGYAVMKLMMRLGENSRLWIVLSAFVAGAAISVVFEVLRQFVLKPLLLH